MRKGYYTHWHRHSHLRIRILIGEAARGWHAATRAIKMRKGEFLELLNFCTDDLGLPRGVANPGRGCQANIIVRRGLPGKYHCLDGKVTIGLGVH